MAIADVNGPMGSTANARAGVGDDQAQALVWVLSPTAKLQPTPLRQG